ncbi:unnamed protein product [Lathyrus oleraceus]
MLQYLFFFMLLLGCVSSSYDEPLAANTKIYIVYTGDTIKDEASCLLHYNYLLQQQLDNKNYTLLLLA